MYQLLDLINNLETELQKIDNTESISLRISNNQKFDFQINQNIYYRAGIFFIVISLLINLLIRFKIAPIDWQQLRLFPISVGIPFYFYGVYTHFKKTKDISFIKQTFGGLFIGFLIIIIIHFIA